MPTWTFRVWVLALLFVGALVARGANLNGFLVRTMARADAATEAVAFSDIFWQSPQGGSITTLSGSIVVFDKTNVSQYVYVNESYWRQMAANANYQSFRLDILDKEIVVPGSKPTITSDEEIRPYVAASKALALVTKLAPSFKDVLADLQKATDAELAHYDKGEKKVNGRWLTTAQFEAQTKGPDSSAAPGSFDITTLDGKVYKQASNIKLSADTVSFTCASGGATVDLAILTPDLQKKFGYDARAREEERASREKIEAQSDVAEKASVLAMQEQADADQRDFVRNPSKNVLTGQVFISEKSGDNLKLGGVHVALYALSQIGLVVGPKNQEALKQLTLLNDSLQQAAQEYADADAAEKNQQSIVENGVYIDPAQRKKDLRQKMQIIQQGREVYLSPDFYFSNLPVPLAETETDADGKFTMTIPVGKYVLAAKAERQILLFNQRYRWMVKFDMGTLARTVLLSNDNLSSSGSDDSVIMTQ